MHKPPFTIFVPERLCVAGGVVHGFIELDFRLLQEEDIDEVHLKLRGHAETSITSNNQTVRENIDLVRFKVSIWTRGSAYPPPGSHALVIPFDIPIRPGIPPSFVHIRVEERVVIHYYIGVVGVRPGALRSNRRLNLPIIVVPPDPSGARVRLSLESGWTGPWATETGRKRLRKGIWGAKAKVECELTHPLLPAIPINVKIPFSISIVAHSKEVAFDGKEKLWPTLSHDPKKVYLELRRRLNFRARYRERLATETVASIGGLHGSQGDVDVETFEREWIPSNTGSDTTKGRWRQEVCFTSYFKLSCTPNFTMQSPAASIEYWLHLRVEFGLFKTLSLNIPVVVVSGLVPQESRARTSELQSSGADASQRMDMLPPAYWTLADNAGHED